MKILGLGTRQWSILAAVAGLTALNVYAGKACAAVVNMSWTAPTQCTDGTAISNCALTGYDALCISMQPTGGASGACATPLRNVASPTATSFAYDVGTPPAQGALYSFAMRAKSANGDSANSNTATKTFGVRTPNAPTGLTISQLLEMDDEQFIAFLGEPLKEHIEVDVLVRSERFAAGPRGSQMIRTVKEVVRFERVVSL